MKQFFAIPSLALVSILGIGLLQGSAQEDCPEELQARFMDVASYVQTQNYAQPTLSISCTPDMMIVASNGITNFEYIQVNVGDMGVQDYQWQIPRNPVLADEPTAIPLVGPVAIVTNGLPVFGPNEAPQDDYGDPLLDNLLDYCGGHIGPNFMYHFHTPPVCLYEVEEPVGVVIGYAFDGFPILTPYVCANADCSETTKLQSSWQRTSDVRNAWEANEYIEGSGDLDQCNGMTLEDGSYAYFATDTFPYYLGCYVGEVDEAMLMPPQGQNGQQNQQGGQNPPPQGQGGTPPPPPPQGQGGQNPPPTRRP